MVACHYFTGCHNPGAYVIQYRSTYTHSQDKIKTQVDILYGACEAHIINMRLGFNGLVYMSEIRVSVDEPEIIETEVVGAEQS